MRLHDDSSHWFKVDHDETRFPGFSRARGALSRELDAFFDAVTFSRGTFADLFLSNVGFVNADTASIYGIDPGDYNETLSRIELDPQKRPGFLTRAAFLSSYSGFDATSPILRGSFVTASVLGLTTSAPDLTAPATNLDDRQLATQREYTEALYEPAGCQPCHAYVLPAGYALENYDAIGAWQTIDPRGGAIDAVADVFFGDRVETIETPLELMQKLAASKHAQRRYAEALVSYALESPLNPQHACLADQLADQLADDVPLLDLWVTIATSEHFRSGKE